MTRLLLPRVCTDIPSLVLKALKSLSIFARTSLSQIKKHQSVGMHICPRQNVKPVPGPDLVILEAPADGCIAHLEEGRQQHLQQLSSNGPHCHRPLSFHTKAGA